MRMKDHQAPDAAHSLQVVSTKSWARVKTTLPPAQARWCEVHAFYGKAGQTCVLPTESGGVARVLVGVDDATSRWSYGHLPRQLPPGTYRLSADGLSDLHLAGSAGGTAGGSAQAQIEKVQAQIEKELYLGFQLGLYQYGRYKSTAQPTAKLALCHSGIRDSAQAELDAIIMVRDLVNAPANALGPEELAQCGVDLAAQHSATCTVILGEELLREYPAIECVGKGSSRPPRLMDLQWGEPDAPRVTLVGKGVCFDSGGLNIKSAKSMKLMKKDMGGAAHVLALAHWLMSSNLNIRLRVLVPAVENSVSGSSMRASDVVATRKGSTIEIGHTDAEGRVILSDALYEASKEQPDVLIDFATLTGAARVALGPELPALFCNHDELAQGLLSTSAEVKDPLWRLPLWKSYRRHLDSKIADINNDADTPYAGAITAALFLQSFVAPSVAWAHLDVMAWNVTSRPGRPAGGEAMGLRTCFHYLVSRFG